MLHNLFFRSSISYYGCRTVSEIRCSQRYLYLLPVWEMEALWDIALPWADDTKKTRKAGVLSLLSLACCAIVTNVCLKNLVARTRPYDVIEGLTSLVGIQKDFSFPVRTYGSFLCICGCAVSDITEKIWHTASYSGIPHRIFQNVCGSPLPVRRAWRAVSRQSDRSCGVLGRNKESKGLGK